MGDTYPKHPAHLEQAKLEVGVYVRAVTASTRGGRDISGTIAMIIPAGEQPPAAVHMEPLFRIQVNSTMLVRESIPTRPSKYDRVLIEVRPGRTFVFTKDKWTRFYKASRQTGK